MSLCLLDPVQVCCYLMLHDGSFCFCSLHAHMRLTEGLFKVFYSRSIAKGKTKQLNAAMQQHLNLKDRIKEVEGDGGKKTWKKCALKGYECYAFSTLPADSNNQAESAIERVIRETFPPRVEQSQSSAGAASGKAIKRARALTAKEKR